MKNKFGSLKCLALLLVFVSCCANAQTKKAKAGQKPHQGMVFRDTLYDIAFDSLSNDMTAIRSKQSTLVKHFKYLGSKPLIIVKTWTQDPHFICEYPREPLLPNRVYAFTVCFLSLNFPNLEKRLGFDFSDGSKIVFRFYKNPVVNDAWPLYGKVTDVAGNALPYVNVFVVSDPGRHVHTDLGGRFWIVARPNELLRFESVGMESQTVTAYESDRNIRLMADERLRDPVQPYQEKQSTKDIQGPIVPVTAEDLLKK